MTPDLDSLRATVAERKLELADAERLGHSPDEVRTAVRAWAEFHAADGDRRLRRLVALAAADGRAGHEALSGVDPAALLAALLGPAEIVKRIEPYIRALPDGPGAAERTARVAELRAQLFAAELAEEAAVVALENSGHPVQRRPDADPAAVLCVAPPEPTA